MGSGPSNCFHPRNGTFRGPLRPGRSPSLTCRDSGATAPSYHHQIVSVTMGSRGEPIATRESEAAGDAGRPLGTGQGRAPGDARATDARQASVVPAPTLPP